MTVTCKQEIINTLSWDKDGNPIEKEVKYVVSGAIGSETVTGESQAFDAVKPAAPATLTGLALSKFMLDQNKGGGTYIFNAIYEESNVTGEGVVSTNDASTGKYSFDINAGGSMLIKQSLKTIGKFGSTGYTPPDLKGNINDDGKTVHGVNRRTPVATFSETHRIKKSKVTTTYKRILNRLVTTVNDGTFRGYSQGEVMFLGVSGTQRDDEDWDLTFRFAVSPTRKNVKIGDIVVAQIHGWDYAWVRHERGTTSDGKDRAMIPKAVYVERIYLVGDFNFLGIGN
jgi:hypothetical protein